MSYPPEWLLLKMVAVMALLAEDTRRM